MASITPQLQKSQAVLKARRPSQNVNVPGEEEIYLAVPPLLQCGIIPGSGGSAIPPPRLGPPRNRRRHVGHMSSTLQQPPPFQISSSDLKQWSCGVRHLISGPKGNSVKTASWHNGQGGMGRQELAENAPSCSGTCLGTLPPSASDTDCIAFCEVTSFGKLPLVPEMPYPRPAAANPGELRIARRRPSRRGERPKRIRPQDLNHFPVMSSIQGGLRETVRDRDLLCDTTSLMYMLQYNPRLRRGRPSTREQWTR